MSINTPYNIVYSISSDKILSLYHTYTNKANHNEVLTIVSDFDIDVLSDQAIFTIQIPRGRLFLVRDFPKSILRYIENSENVNNAMEYLNSVLLRKIFANSNVIDIVPFSKKALTTSSHIINNLEIIEPKTDISKYIITFMYSFANNEVSIYLMDTALLSKLKGELEYQLCYESASVFKNLDIEKNIFKEPDFIQVMLLNDLSNISVNNIENTIYTTINTYLIESNINILHFDLSKSCKILSRIIKHMALLDNMPFGKSVKEAVMNALIKELTDSNYLILNNFTDSL